MNDFLNFFNNKRKTFPMHLEILYNKTCDWSIYIYKKGYKVSIGGGTAKGTYLLSEVLEAVKNGRRMFGANPLFDFVDDGKFNLELAELCNNAYQAVRHKREMLAGRPFSVTDEIDLAWLWYDMRYYFNLNTAIIRGDPLPKYESPEERLIKIWGLDKLSKKDSTF